MGRHFDLGQDFSDFYQIQITGRRQLQTTPYPTKQQMLEQFFELCDLFTDRTLGQVQLLRRADKTQITNHNFKTLQNNDLKIYQIKDGRNKYDG